MFANITHCSFDRLMEHSVFFSVSVLLGLPWYAHSLGNAIKNKLGNVYIA
jgi:hypothetical protein